LRNLSIVPRLQSSNRPVQKKERPRLPGRFGGAAQRTRLRGGGSADATSFTSGLW
jgi:hypothetical protein